MRALALLFAAALSLSATVSQSQQAFEVVSENDREEKGERDRHDAHTKRGPAHDRVGEPGPAGVSDPVLKNDERIEEEGATDDTPKQQHDVEHPQPINLGGKVASLNKIATDHSAFATWISALAAVAATYLLCRTLRVTRAMLIEAKKTTDAANATVQVTRDIGQAQARAYLSISCAEVLSIIAPVDEAVVKGIRITIRNSGLTPATSIRIKAICFRSSEFSPEQNGIYGLMARRGLKTRIIDIVDAGGEITFSCDAEMDERVLDTFLQDDSGDLVVAVDAEYRTVFDEVHTSRAQFDAAGYQVADFLTNADPSLSKPGILEMNRVLLGIE